MASENGSLALSDIIHLLSPSPAPHGPSDMTMEPHLVSHPFEGQQQEPTRLSSLEPTTEENVSNYRTRLVEMGLSTDGMDKSKGHTSSREEELLDMVLALTRPPLISSTQLVAQANMIVNLQMQQEHMLFEMEEERARWEAERNGWERMAEALIAQRNKPGSGATANEDLERKCSYIESDNRILKDHLQDAHRRANALEAELAKLKPMLFMLPHSQAAADKGKKRKQPTPDEPRTESADRYPYYQIASSSGAKNTNPYLAYAISTRQPTAQPSSSKQKRRSTVSMKTTTLASDARTEHLLLAARKIGRERTAMLAGLVQQAEGEKEQYGEAARAARESERLEKERLERVKSGAAGGMYYRSGGVARGGEEEQITPKRVAAQQQQVGRQSTFVYVKNPGQQTAGNEDELLAASTDHTPRLQHVGLPQQQTPIDSLLSAARSMMQERAVPEVGNGDGNGNGKRSAAALEDPETPVPKRRRTMGGRVSVTKGGPSGGGSGNLGKEVRVPSALDVLADQAQVAAALPSQMGSSTSTPRLDVTIEVAEEVEEPVSKRKITRGKVKGKGKAKAELEEIEEVRGGPGSERESEIEFLEGKDESLGNTAPSPPPPPPHLRLERRKRGRPRKDKSMVSPRVETTVKEEGGSIGGSRRTARDRDVASTSNASASTSSMRTRGMKDTGSGASATVPSEKKRKGKTVAAPPAAARATSSVPPSTPRIIAPPPSVGPIDFILVDGGGSGTRTYPAGHEKAKMLGLGQFQAQEMLAPPVSGKDTDKAEGDRRYADEEGDLESRHLRVQSANEGCDQVVGVGGGRGGQATGGLGPVTRWDDRKGSRSSTPEEGGSGSDFGEPCGESKVVTVDIEEEEEGQTVQAFWTHGTPDQQTDSVVVMRDVAKGKKSSVPHGSVFSPQDPPLALMVLGEAPLSAPGSLFYNGLHLVTGPLLSKGLVGQSLKSPAIVEPGSSSAKHLDQRGSQINPSGTGILTAAPIEAASSSFSSASVHRHESISKPFILKHNYVVPLGPPLTGDKAFLATRKNVENFPNGILNKANVGHDSGLDGEAEVNPDGVGMDAEADEDLDAEGEDEDDREADGAPSTWSHVAFSSSDVSKLLQSSVQGADGDEDDADAEGEIEDDSYEPLAAVLRPSQPA